MTVDAERIAQIRARWDGLSSQTLSLGSEVLADDIRILLQAPTDIADLLAEVERLQGGAAEAVGALCHPDGDEPRGVGRTVIVRSGVPTYSPALVAENLGIIEVEIAHPWRLGPNTDDDRDLWWTPRITSFTDAAPDDDA